MLIYTREIPDLSEKVFHISEKEVINIINYVGNKINKWKAAE